jgi:tRNA A-37 threonylcarbamoyl transferase component Bud32
MQTDPDTINPPEKIKETAHRSHSDVQTYIQYGNTVNDQFKLRAQLRLHKVTAGPSPLTGTLLCVLPFFIMDWIFVALWMSFPSPMIQTYIMYISPREVPTLHTMFIGMRALWDFTLGVGLTYCTIIAYAMRQSDSNIFRPTHLAVGPDGLGFIYNHFILSDLNIKKRLHWKAISSIVVRKRKNKIGQTIKTLEVRGRDGRLLKIDLRRFLREQDREYLARVVKLCVPDLSQDLDMQELVHLDNYQPSYTRLWSQSLLTPPVRERRSSLEPDTALNEGRFRVIQRIGSGGQGTAYLAEARNDDAFEETLDQVVLKEYVLPDLEKMHDRHRALKKLEKEVSLLSRLTHPGIASFIDVFVEDHRAYLVSEFVDGPSLRKKVELEGTLSELQVITLALQMCDVLTYLHSLEPVVVHQDFTPENLILCNSGAVKLIDFNVAREAITIKTALVVGKQSYMPPEQFKGKATAQSDVFALGCTLYFLLTGADAEPLTVARPAERRMDISPAFNAIVERATALDLGNRYMSASDLKTDLLQLLADQLCAEPPVSPDHISHTIQIIKREAEEVIL